ncbi:hypothetical protein PR202_gb17946 [Eleusine coracana subsp. coracana]|uniref:Uncharacterized protein n=1 Tax=Eleusine coracana subsp. coracana TaxID=191504 RepID=A0AAV5F4E0_ELECO|nr:hypothetical protein PR202_gb17946 [Eleusine coracana subsp. coracana]
MRGGGHRTAGGAAPGDRDTAVLEQFWPRPKQGMHSGAVLPLRSGSALKSFPLAVHSMLRRPAAIAPSRRTLGAGSGRQARLRTTGTTIFR